MTGTAIKVSTTAAGLTVPSSVNIAWGRTTVTFSATASASMSPQSATVTATGGGVTKNSAISVTASANYSISSLTCTPSTLIPAETANCVAYLSAQAPASGATVTLSSSSANLSVPATVAIAGGSNGFTFQAKAAKTASSIENVTVTASTLSASRTVPIKIDPTPRFYYKGNNTEMSVLA